MLPMCGQDPLAAVTYEGNSWSKARNIGMLENMLGMSLDAAANRYRIKRSSIIETSLAEKSPSKYVSITLKNLGRHKEVTDYAIGD